MTSEVPYIGRYWKALDEDRIQCELCPHQCILKEGQRGICFVRACQDHKMVLTTYGRSSGFCVDPIEKKPLNHFLPGTPVLSFGTAGCNLQCAFCQNSSITCAREMEILAARASPERIAQAAQELGCRSVAFTYNDPVIFLEYAVDIAKACHELGVKTVAVTAGYMAPEPCKEFFAHMDAANIDLKAFSEDFYKRLCGADLQTVLDVLRYVKNETSTWLELTTLLIPGENDSEEELDAMTQWIVAHLGPDIPHHFTAFHPAHKLTRKPMTRGSALLKAREIAQRNGIKHVFIGNIRDVMGGSTYCSNCRKGLIGRDGYEITGWNLDKEGKCIQCHTPCIGVFEEKPGDWGSRCQPVRL